MITSISVIKPSGEQYLEVGAKLLNKEKKEIEITVKKIIVIFNTAWVTFSDGKQTIFSGFPFIITKK